MRYKNALRAKEPLLQDQQTVLISPDFLKCSQETSEDKGNTSPKFQQNLFKESERSEDKRNISPQVQQNFLKELERSEDKRNISPQVQQNFLKDSELRANRIQKPVNRESQGS